MIPAQCNPFPSFIPRVGVIPVFRLIDGVDADVTEQSPSRDIKNDEQDDDVVMRKSEAEEMFKPAAARIAHAIINDSRSDSAQLACMDRLASAVFAASKRKAVDDADEGSVSGHSQVAIEGNVESKD